ncbi:MAG: universal stress protein [Bacteroidia bacterium]
MLRILLPTDFSPTAGNAFAYAYASQLAAQIEAEIVLIHAYSLIEEADLFTPEVEIRRLRASREAEAMQIFETYKQQLQQHNLAVPLSVVLKHGYPMEVIGEACIELLPDLLVMGTKGGGNQLDVLLGSVTARVIQDVEVPVLAVPERAIYRGIGKIAYATDLETCDHDIAARVGQLAARLDAHIVCVHVGDKLPQHLGLEELRQIYQRDTGYDKLDLYLFPDDDVAAGLQTFIHSQDIDLLAVVAHRRSIMQRLFHQSLTRKLALTLDIPLLAYHELIVR